MDGNTSRDAQKNLNKESRYISRTKIGLSIQKKQLNKILNIYKLYENKRWEIFAISINK